MFCQNKTSEKLLPPFEKGGAKNFNQASAQARFARNDVVPYGSMMFLPAAKMMFAPSGK